MLFMEAKKRHVDATASNYRCRSFVGDHQTNKLKKEVDDLPFPHFILQYIIILLQDPSVCKEVSNRAYYQSFPDRICRRETAIEVRN